MARVPDVTNGAGIKVPLKLDAYDTVARLCPALLAVLPVSAAVYLVAVQLGWRPWLAILGGLVSGCGLSILASQWVGDRGREWERRWIAAEGALPSVGMLRHRDGRVRAQLKARYHMLLQANVPGIRLPTPNEEAADPSAADGQYEAACAWLRARARRGRTSNLLARHLRAYGFRRNLMALRPALLLLDAALAGISISLSVAARWTMLPAPWPALAELGPAVACFAFVHATLAAVILRRTWVEHGAEAYARSLLEECDGLPNPPMHKKRSTPSV